MRKKHCNQSELPDELNMYVIEKLLDAIQCLRRKEEVFCYENTIAYIGQTISFALEKVMDWSKWQDKIPCLQFDPEWEVHMTPPFAGAIVRFAVRNSAGIWVNVYLDCYDALGLMKRPYWEVYPYDESGPARVLLDEKRELIQRIRESFEFQDKLGVDDDS